MEYYRCESPDCEFVTMQEDRELCPLCGGTAFVPVTEEEITPRGWLSLCREAARAGNQEQAFGFCCRGGEDPACLCEQGRRLYSGKGTVRSLEKAADCFERAAAQGSADGRCLLGLCFEKGEGRPQSWENAIFLYKQAADENFAPAQCNLGWCYEFGKGVPMDKKAAAYWYGEAALKKDPRGQCCLAVCYLNGIGVGQDTARAVQLYELSAATGYPPARYALGELHRAGRGV